MAQGLSRKPQGKPSWLEGRVQGLSVPTHKDMGISVDLATIRNRTKMKEAGRPLTHGACVLIREGQLGNKHQLSTNIQ